MWFLARLCLLWLSTTSELEDMCSKSWWSLGEVKNWDRNSLLEVSKHDSTWEPVRRRSCSVPNQLLGVVQTSKQRMDSGLKLWTQMENVYNVKDSALNGFTMCLNGFTTYINGSKRFCQSLLVCDTCTQWLFWAAKPKMLFAHAVSTPSDDTQRSRHQLKNPYKVGFAFD